MSTLILLLSGGWLGWSASPSVNMNDRCVSLSIQIPEISWRNFNLCNIVTHFKSSYLLILALLPSCGPCITTCHAGPGVYRPRPWFSLLPQPLKTKYSRCVALSEYIPPAKIHRPCFLNLAQWSVYLEWKCSERRSHGAQHGWLKGKVMTLSACVFGSCETTAGSSPLTAALPFLSYYSHQKDIDIDCCSDAYPPSYAGLA